MTFISRVFGFVRDMVAAYFFGASHGYDAFILAFKIPNMMRRLFAEGAFAQAFVPIVSEYKAKKSKKDVHEFINHVAGNLLLILTIVTIIGVLLSPLIIKLFAPGFDALDSRAELATSMLRITFPYMLLVSLTAFCGGILNSYGRFGGPAFTPVILNLSLIGCAIYLSPHFPQPEYALAWGVIIGGICQLFFQIPFLIKLKLLPKPKINWQDPGVRRVVILMGPAVFGAAVSQINSLIDTLFASFLPAGSISWLYFADRLMEFPLGVFGVGLATVVLPNLSREFALNSNDQFSMILDWGVKLVLLVGIPACAGLYILSGPLVTALYYSGKFSVSDVTNSSNALVAYSLAVVGIMLAKVLSSGFYARQDIKTPVKVSIIVISINIILNAILISKYMHVGIAIATSIASVCNALILMFILKKRAIYNFKLDNIIYIARILLATASFVFIIQKINPSMDYWLELGRLERFIKLLPLVFLGVAVYAFVLFITGFRKQHLLLAKEA